MAPHRSYHWASKSIRSAGSRLDLALGSSSRYGRDLRSALNIEYWVLRFPPKCYSIFGAEPNESRCSNPEPRNSIDCEFGKIRVPQSLRDAFPKHGRRYPCAVLPRPTHSEPKRGPRIPTPSSGSYATGGEYVRDAVIHSLQTYERLLVTHAYGI